MKTWIGGILFVIGLLLCVFAPERISGGSKPAMELSLTNGTETVQYQTRQTIVGNVLLDGGVRLFPGDRIFWKDTEVRPDFPLDGLSEASLRVVHGIPFTLYDDSGSRTVYGYGSTVGDALASAGIPVSKSMPVVPDPETPFTEGMTVEALTLRPLQVVRNGVRVDVLSAGSTVGEALRNAGLPLMGSDQSIPASTEALPADGRILVVPARDAFTVQAESEKATITWQANDDLPLDSTREISAGQNGLKGSFGYTHYENGVEVSSQTSAEQLLTETRSAVWEYGTKIELKTLDTSEGPLQYYRSVPVYATSYSPCRSGTSGCISGTASGRKVEKGVIAVTSAWYNRFAGQRVYIPDYGTAVIADSGGGIPGKHWVDLAYSDDDYVAWSKDTTLYFLAPVPEDITWVLN